MGRLHTALRDGGYLFLGHSETLWQVSEDFRLVALGTATAPPSSTAASTSRPPSAAGVPAGPAHVAGARRPPPDPAHRAAPRHGRGWSAARAEVRGQSAPAAPRAPVELLPAVREALSEGRYDDAARWSRLAGDADPLRSEVHYLLGLALVDQGLDAEALPPLRRARLPRPGGRPRPLPAGRRAGPLRRPAGRRPGYRAAAQTLSRTTDGAAPELGGRSAQELAALCAQLEGQLSAGSER
jgi:chemotaxis protein methyltransferase CheR